MVVSSDFRMGQYKDDHRGNAAHFGGRKCHKIPPKYGLFTYVKETDTFLILYNFSTSYILMLIEYEIQSALKKREYIILYSIPRYD